MTTIEKRSEVLFCYDVTDANPNGDPLDENKPRIDEEAKVNIITDVRLKRTVRDYLFDYKGYNGTAGKDIFVREILMEKDKPESGIQDGKTRAKDFAGKDDILNKCIDVRLFGGVIPLDDKKKAKKKDDEDTESNDSKAKSYTFTGPVQFKIGRSLHKVELKHLKGTGAFASKAGAGQKTFREEYILPYSFIAFHGIVNETAAKETRLSEEDVKELMEALWNGSKNLISRSKFGHMPRFLLKVTYKEKGYFIGDLEKKIKMTGHENDFKVRNISDFTLDISELVKSLLSDKVEKVEYLKCDNLKTNQELPTNWVKIII
ncbi:MAG TPA: type I-B CRISPR-associated protein Cas7/Csh2 [bacterium]|nr:type I-B CRISPR-associated protein Cas7/Csh2 [bacterium]